MGQVTGGVPGEMPSLGCTEGTVRKEKVITETKDSALGVAIDKEDPPSGFIIDSVASDHHVGRFT
jgi:hypothetical protein